MADELDVEALLEAPFQKEKPKDVENGRDKREEDDRVAKRSSDDKDDRDSKRRRRSASPHRERPHRDGDRDRERERDRDRDRERESRDRDRERERGRDRDRERERERERDRDRDRYREHRRSSRRSRSRSRDRSSRNSSERDDREFERDKRREREERDRREREMTEADREAAEAERDGRTVFAINLPIRASERKLYEFFEKAGKVVDIRLISDRNSRKSKGFGYVEYADKATVPKALALSGSTFMGQPIIVQVTQAEKNRVVNTSSSTAAASGPTRLYVGSLHFNITEDDLKSVFGPFGDIDFINLHMDPETGRSKGFGFVQFKKADDAKRALQQVNGLEIAGRQIKVGLVNESNTITGVGGGTLGELDDDEGGGFSLNIHSRQILMAKLQRGPPLTAAPVPAPVVPMVPGVVPVMPMGFGVPPLNPALTGTPLPINPALAPSTCILLKNMFDPTTETDPNFHLDIKEDVIEECSKYGTVVHAFVDKDTQGHVYLKFSTLDGAQKASNALNHRWFAGKMITAENIPEAVYLTRFPEAKT